MNFTHLDQQMEAFRASDAAREEFVRVSLLSRGHMQLTTTINSR